MKEKDCQSKSVGIAIDIFHILPIRYSGWPTERKKSMRIIKNSMTQSQQNTPLTSETAVSTPVNAFLDSTGGKPVSTNS